jgi:hypothetical protein
MSQDRLQQKMLISIRTTGVIFIPRLLRQNGNSGWASTIKCLSPTSSVNDLWCPVPTNQEVGTIRNVAFNTCKHCDRVEPGSCANLLSPDLDRMVECGNRKCLKSSWSRDWRCACEEYWFTCAQHAKSVACGSQPTQSHGQAESLHLSLPGGRHPRSWHRISRRCSRLISRGAGKGTTPTLLSL